MWHILCRNEHFAAVCKPAGVAVHAENGDIPLTVSAAQALGVERVWLVHRLDKATSGVLLLALDRQAASDLAQMFADKKIRKTYLALSSSKPAKKQGLIKGGMERSRRGTWKLTRKAENLAVTRFVSHAAGNGVRLFVLQPHTGKTHQLRVAMKSLGSPIDGDALYGGKAAERMFLHAWHICFTYRDTSFDITAPVGEGWPSETVAALQPPFV